MAGPPTLGVSDYQTGRWHVTTKSGQLLWQVPLTILACVAGSLVIVWLVSGAMGFTMNVSLIAALSAALSAAAIAIELGGGRRH
jgi:hypothetical protein